MSLRRVYGVFMQEYYITKRSLEVILDIFFFSAMSLLVFGLIATFFAHNLPGISAYYLLVGVLLWEVVRITQYGITVASLWNIWSRNLTNMLITPMSLREYLLAHTLSALAKAAICLAAGGVLLAWLFGFNILVIGWPTIIVGFFNLAWFAISLGLLLLGFVFYFGQRIQALAWGVVFIFQPLCAAYFPVSVFPPFVRAIALALPPTHVFEAARAGLTNPALNWREAAVAAGLNVVYFVIAVGVFQLMFSRARRTGQLARNDA